MICQGATAPDGSSVAARSDALPEGAPDGEPAHERRSVSSLPRPRRFPRPATWSDERRGRIRSRAPTAAAGAICRRSRPCHRPVFFSRRQTRVIEDPRFRPRPGSTDPGIYVGNRGRALRLVRSGENRGSRRRATDPYGAPRRQDGFASVGPEPVAIRVENAIEIVLPRRPAGGFRRALLLRKLLYGRAAWSWPRQQRRPRGGASPKRLGFTGRGLEESLLSPDLSSVGLSTRC
jgi:hypothetical protein